MSWTRTQWAAALLGCVIGVLGVELLDRLIGPEPEAPIAIASPTATLDASLARELDELRRLVEAREAAHERKHGSTPETERAADAVVAGDAAFGARIAALEQALEQARESVAALSNKRDPVVPNIVEQQTIAQLTAQALDPTLATRVRLDSLELLAQVDASQRPFAAVNLDELKLLVEGVRDTTRRKRSYKWLRPHVDLNWLLFVTNAARKEPDDLVRSEIIEMLHPIAAEPAVRVALAEIRGWSDLGPKSRDSIADLLR